MFEWKLKRLIKARVEELLEDKSKLLMVKYFDIWELLEEKYGKDLIILIEIGSFFEIYEVNNDEFKIGKAKEIAELLNIQLTRKNKSIIENSKTNPLMAGVPTVSFDKHLQRIISEQKYTVAIIKQKGTPPKVTRYLDIIVSPGTNFDFITTQDENNITSLVIDRYKNANYHIGYSAIDISTGKCYFNDVYGSKEDSNFALDEVFNYMNMHKTTEIIITFLDKSINQKEVLDYLEVKSKTFHINKFKPKISYQNELFKSVFTINGLLSPIEYLDMEKSPMASESLAILIDFVIAHDSKIIKKLSYPIRLDLSHYLYLGNNAIEQLNIIDTPHNPSLFRIINNTSTAMGKRLLKERLTHPIKDIKELNRRYELSENLYDCYMPIEAQLNNIYDIERLSRRIKLSRIHPFEINYLYESLLSISDIIHFIKPYNFIDTPCSKEDLRLFIDSINSSFNLELSAKFMLKDINENIINSGINSQIDELLAQNRVLMNKLELIRVHILSFLTPSDSNFININRLEKDGFFISLTKNRYSSIKKELLESHIIIDDNLYLLKDFKIKIQTNSVKLTNPFIDDISDKYVHNFKKIIALNHIVFKSKVLEFEDKFSILLDELVSFIAEIDFSVSNIKTSKKYNYSKPIIIDLEDKNDNFIEISKVRHPIIEVNEERGLYVTNDIILGNLSQKSKLNQKSVIIKNSNKITNKVHGILLYGINSSGKSSLMKAIGVSVILAQSGLFVPASSMRFSPFDAVFTRISGADNISKGLSSFAVEMLDLKNIFNRATNKSLILGDEISHSTETMSGVSIVASAILKLSKLKSIFIFATHLHQLNEIAEIAKLKNILPLHLSVIYNEVEDKLIFDRKLKYGSGSSQYGLEFAKSLHMDSEFLKVANDIRKRVSDDYNHIERLNRKKRSGYNKNLYMSSCALCSSKVDDIHHIKEQKEADNDGFIGHIRQNHKYNLIPLCKKHHKMVHNGEIIISGFIATTSGLELHYRYIKDN